jgi:hypothetical protein
MLKGSSYKPTALRACASISATNTSRIRSVKPLMNAGCLTNPGAEFTIPIRDTGFLRWFILGNR